MSYFQHHPRLFTVVNEDEVLSKPTFEAFAHLMDNYKPDVKIVEDRTAFERAEESRFLDLVLETPVMQTAYKFMVDKGMLFFTGSVYLFYAPESERTKLNSSHTISSVFFVNCDPQVRKTKSWENQVYFYNIQRPNNTFVWLPGPKTLG